MDFCKSESFHLRHQVLAILLMIISRPLLAEDPLCRQDALGHYRLHNEEQCRRLCWYRSLCSSYSYNHKDQATPPSTSDPNCVLHTVSALTVSSSTCPSPSPAERWTEHASSSSGILNSCRDQPCGDLFVCVPHPHPHGISSPHCLPQCGPPPQVVSGRVTVSGSWQGDTARVTCHKGFVASPKGVSLDLTCQASSAWTPFMGSCLLYQFQVEGASHFIREFPRPLKDSTVCIKGSYIGGGQMSFNLQPESTVDTLDVHFLFKNPKVEWTTKFNNRYDGKHRPLQDVPLTVGAQFVLQIRLLANYLQVTFNTHILKVPLVGPGVTDGLDLSRSKFIVVENRVNIQYINLLTGCDAE